MTRPALGGGSAAPVHRPRTVAADPSPKLTVALASRCHCWALVPAEAWTLSGTMSPVNGTFTLVLRYAVSVPPGAADAGACVVIVGGRGDAADSGPEVPHPARTTTPPTTAPTAMACQRL